jgi:predicted alpha/beta-fold hydrolase
MLDDRELLKCDPPFWAKTGHLQTILGHVLPSAALSQSAKDVVIELSDQEKLTAQIFVGRSPFVVLIFHGLTGSIDSGYMQRSARIALAQGHTCVLINHRGCGTGRGLASKPYHSGRGDDVSDVVKWARQNFRDKKIITLGFSLSANAILTLLTGLRGTEQPDLAMIVNGPIDLTAASHALKKGLNRIYDFRFVQQCREDIFYRKNKGLIEFNHKIPATSYLSDVDELYTAPQAGFKSAQHYYDTCSTAPHLLNIKTPTVLLMAKDDPFIPWQPYELARKNPILHLRLEDHGGHMGYLARVERGRTGQVRQRYSRWMDKAVDFYLRKLTQ